MCVEDGGIVDDFLFYNMGEYYLLVVNGANIKKDWDWMSKVAANFSVQLKDTSDEYNLLAIQGPKTIETLQKLTATDLKNIEFYHFELGEMSGIETIISRTGYTGEIGFELYFKGDVATAEKMWNAIFEAGKEFEIEATGLGARDTLRMEKGYCLYGNDIDETTNPIEAGLGWITKFTKGEFVASELLAKIKADKPSRNLVGILSDAEKFIPRHGYKLFSDDKEIGAITSGNISPTLGKPIAMGYVSAEFKSPGTKIEIEARGKKISSSYITKMPFVRVYKQLSVRV